MVGDTFFSKYVNEEEERSYFIINYDTSISVKLCKFFVNEKVKKNWTKKSLRIDIASDGWHGILVNTPILFYPQSDFSDLLRHFESSFINMLISPYSIETMQLYEYWHCFRTEQRYETLDLDHFLQTNERYL